MIPTEKMIQNFAAKCMAESEQKIIDKLGGRFTRELSELRNEVAELREQINGKDPNEEESEETEEKPGFWD